MILTQKKKASGVRTSLALLKLVSEHADGVTFTELCNGLGGAPNATVSRHLRTLTEEDWIRKSADGKYLPARVFRTVCESVSEKNSRINLIRPEIEKLAEKTGHSAAFAESCGNGFVFRCKKEMPDSYHYIEIGEENRDPTNGFYLTCQAKTGENPNLTSNQIKDAKKRKEAQRGIKTAVQCKAWISEDKGRRFLCAMNHNGKFLGVVGVSMWPAELTDVRKNEMLKIVEKTVAIIEHKLEEAR